MMMMKMLSPVATLNWVSSQKQFSQPKIICFTKQHQHQHQQSLSRLSNVSATTSSKFGVFAVNFAEETSTHDSAPLQKEKLGVVVKPLEKPRLVLKFIWMEKNIGIAIDQVIPGHGTIPLSPYYFWPRKDAWEELQVMLENKPWISPKQKVILLNQATDVINLWQQSGGDLD